MASMGPSGVYGSMRTKLPPDSSTMRRRPTKAAGSSSRSGRGDRIIACTAMFSEAASAASSLFDDLGSVVHSVGEEKDRATGARGSLPLGQRLEDGVAKGGLSEPAHRLQGLADPGQRGAERAVAMGLPPGEEPEAGLVPGRELREEIAAGAPRDVHKPRDLHALRCVDEELDAEGGLGGELEGGDLLEDAVLVQAKVLLLELGPGAPAARVDGGPDDHVAHHHAHALGVALGQDRRLHDRKGHPDHQQRRDGPGPHSASSDLRAGAPSVSGVAAAIRFEAFFSKRLTSSRNVAMVVRSMS